MTEKQDCSNIPPRHVNPTFLTRQDGPDGGDGVESGKYNGANPHKRPIRQHLSPDEIAENMGSNLIEKHGNPQKWKHRYSKREPLTQIGARPGEKKVYEVWEDEYGNLFEYHYEIDDLENHSVGKYVYPSTTEKPR